MALSRALPDEWHHLPRHLFLPFLFEVAESHEEWSEFPPLSYLSQDRFQDEMRYGPHWRVAPSLLQNVFEIRPCMMPIALL